jgi:predicted transcriptional regulator
MAQIAGISTQKDNKGNILKVTFDLKKHGAEIMPILVKMGAVEEDDFEKEWRKAETVEESLGKLKAEMRSWDWKA